MATEMVVIQSQTPDIDSTDVHLFPIAHHGHGPMYTLQYPSFIVVSEDGKSSRLNPKLIAQLLVACVALFALAFMYIGATFNPA